MREYTYFYKPEELKKLKPVFKYQVSDIFISFIENFSKLFTKFTGLELVIKVPDIFSVLPSNVEEQVQQIGKLIELKIIKTYYKFPHLHGDEPKLLMWTANIEADKDTVCEDSVGGVGVDFFDEKVALQGMIGESAERFAVVNYDPPEALRITDSYSNISKKLPAINPMEYVGYSKGMREKGTGGAPLYFDEDTSFDWVEGYSLTENSNIYMPVQMLGFKAQDRLVLKKKSEPLIILNVTTGAAVYSEKNEAIWRGILEIIERDAFMIYWVRKITPQQIDLRDIQDERINKAQKLFKEKNLEYYALYLKTDAPVHTVLGIVIDSSGIGPAVNVGAGSHKDIHEAIYKSMTEVTHTRLWLRLRIDKSLTEERKSNKLQPKTLDQEGRLLFWAQPEKIKDISFLISGDKVKVSELPTHEYPSDSRLKVKQIIKFFKENKYEVSYKEILDKETIKKLGLTAVFVQIPAFQPLHLNEINPCFSGDRLEKIPESIGLSPRAKIHTDPHPFP